MNGSVEKTLESLKKNGFSATYFNDCDSAVKYLMENVKNGETVGIGGSMTVKTLGIPEKLIEKGNTVYFHWLESTPEGAAQARRNAAHADVYITSTNALSEDGQLVNTDKTGNRVTAMVYGPTRVYVICGVNKIAKDLDAAIQRVKDNSYKNARRLKLNTPCAVTEKCNDCSSPQRMCNVTTIIERKPTDIEFEVILVNQELGF